MKKSFPWIASAALAVTTAIIPLTQFGTVYADGVGDHSALQVNAQGQVQGQADKDVGKLKGSTLVSLLTGGDQGKDGHDSGDVRGKQKGKGHKPAKAAVTAKTQSKSQVDALHKALQQLQADRKTESSLHKQLVKEARQYINLMQIAIVTGNTTVVQQGNTSIESILTQLRTALSAQHSEDADVDIEHHAEKHGDLQQSLNAVGAVDSRLQTKIKAMQAAVNELQTLVTQFQGELQANGTASNGTTGSGNTSGSASASTSTGSSNTGANSDGSVTITVTNSSSTN